MPVGSTATDPTRVDPTGTTAQPITSVDIGLAADAAVTTNTTGTLSGKLRGLVAILADVWDSTNHWLKTQLQAGENHVGALGGHTIVVSDGLTRPADTTAYSIGDLVNSNTVAGSIYVMNFVAARVSTGSFAVMRVRLRKTTNVLTNASFRVHLYSAAPTVTNGDNGAWLSNLSIGYLGSFDLTCDKVFNTGDALGFSDIAPIYHKLASAQTIYALLEARAAYVPGSNESFYVYLEVVQD